MKAVLHLFSHVSTTFNAEARDKVNDLLISLAEAVMFTAAHRCYDPGHVVIPLQLQ
jgi:hypothetical protein